MQALFDLAHHSHGQPVPLHVIAERQKLSLPFLEQIYNKLKKAGFAAYTEPLETSKGTLWRVRVGPYPSREAAAAGRDKLKGEGYSGIVAAAR